MTHVPAPEQSTPSQSGGNGIGSPVVELDDSAPAPSLSELPVTGPEVVLSPAEGSTHWPATEPARSL
jgi:hypothetical protein